MSGLRVLTCTTLFSRLKSPVLIGVTSQPTFPQFHLAIVSASQTREHNAMPPLTSHAYKLTLLIPNVVSLPSVKHASSHTVVLLHNHKDKRWDVRPEGLMRTKKYSWIPQETILWDQMYLRACIATQTNICINLF